MRIFRIVGAILVAVSGFLGAYILNSRAKSAIAQIDGLIMLVRHIKNEIECFCVPIPTAFARCSCEIYERCGLRGEGAPTDADSFFAACAITDSQAKEQMRRFWGSLGRGYRDEQVSLCDLCVSALEARRRELVSQLPSKIKVNSSLCVCSSLLVVILLL